MTKEQKSADPEGRMVLRIDSSDETDADLAEYAYVVRDLRRVALLAGLTFALLIALSFLLR
jgi:hypothetical protein